MYLRCVSFLINFTRTAHGLCVPLNSRLQSNKEEEEEGPLQPVSCVEDAPVMRFSGFIKAV
jgi:hypothetical protein